MGLFSYFCYFLYKKGVIVLRIEELSAGLGVTFLVTIDKEFISFETKIENVYPRKRLVLADAIYYNEKIVSFSGANIHVDVLVKKPAEKPQLFKEVKVSTMRKPDGSLCYNLATDEESKPYNRRQHFRCYIGLPSIVQYGNDHTAQDAVIRDISLSGFSVTCPKDVQLKEHQIVHALFNDYIDELDEKFSLHLYGLIVRSYELENGNVVYGCRLNSRVSGLDSYIAKKERIRLRNTSGGRA